MKLVVASLNPRPIAFLQSLGINPHHHYPRPPEEVVTQEPAVYGREVIERYLKEVTPLFKKKTILALETFLVYRERRIKPVKFKMDVLKILTMFSGHTFTLATFWAVKPGNLNRYPINFTETKITLKTLSETILTGYVNDHDLIHSPLPLDLIDPLSFTLIEKIDGSLNNLLYNIPIENIDLSNI